LFIYIGHVITGIALGMIFQVTHTNMFVVQVKPTEYGKIETSYEQHILRTTSDFSVENKVITWLTGGLNIHAVHHLFPEVNQMHLSAIAKIVRMTAKEFGISYMEFPSWKLAIKSHFQMLKKLGTI
jgi:linoleoyl-CoA desaturase